MGPVTDAHKLTYQRNVELAVQQKVSKFERGFTRQTGLSGRKAQLVDLIGSTSAIVDGARGGDTPNIDNNLEPVWIAPHQIEWGKLIEKEDQIKALTDFQSPFVQAGAAAIVRARDQIYATAIFGPRLIAQDGTTSSAFSSTGRQVTEGIGFSATDDTTVTGMNVRKLIRAKALLQKQELNLDNEELFVGLNSVEIEGLYRDITYVNTDYRDKSVLEGRMVMGILGITVIHTEALPNLDSDTHRAALWAKSGMVDGEFSPLTTRVEPNVNKKYRLHPFMEEWMGATRTEDAKVIEILNKF